MTTFGGQTVPPLFVGVGGFLQGDIRIADVGTTEVGPIGGQAQHTIPNSASNVGDELWVVTHATGSLGDEVGGNWGSALNNFGRQRIYKRVADGTANDDFIMPASTLGVVAKMWTITEVLPFDAFPSAIVQGGFLNTDFQIPWLVSFPPGQPVSMAANATGDPAKFVMFWAFQWTRFAANPNATLSNAPPVAMETIMDEVHFIGQPPVSTDTLYTIIQFAYLPVSIQYDSYEVSYTPQTQSQAHYSHHTRWRIF